jgi:SAM-dependent methyltransferase
MTAAANFTEYSRTHRHVLTGWLPPLLADVSASWDVGTLVDLGCGDGTLISGFIGHGRLPSQVIAVDLSPLRVDAAMQLSPNIEGIVADATNLAEIPDGSVDAVVSSQVIEHVPDDSAVAQEVHRILKPGGWWYIGSVLRGPHAWWIYRRGGQWWMDPTHVREYRTRSEYLTSLRRGGLTVERLRTEAFRFPISDLAARTAVRAGLMAPEAMSRLYDGRIPGLRHIRRASLRVPGYRLIEAVGRRD